MCDSNYKIQFFIYYIFNSFDFLVIQGVLYSNYDYIIINDHSGSLWIYYERMILELMKKIIVSGTTVATLYK